MPAARSHILMLAKAHYAASPGKCIVLAVLAVVMVVIFVVQVAKSPASADAAPLVPITPDPVAIQSVTVIPPRSKQHPGDEPMHSLPDGLPQNLARDLFAIAWNTYPPEDVGDEENHLGHSADNNGDDEDEEELRLEGTYEHHDRRGDRVAVINGRFMRVNDRIGRFTLEVVEDRQVTLRDGDYRIILKMP